MDSSEVSYGLSWTGKCYIWLCTPRRTLMDSKEKRSFLGNAAASPPYSPRYRHFCHITTVMMLWPSSPRACSTLYETISYGKRQTDQPQTAAEACATYIGKYDNVSS